MDLDEHSEIGIDAEVQWGLDYRRQKKKARKPSIYPTSSPINIQLIWQKYQITRQLKELELLNRIIPKPPPKIIKLSFTSQQSQCRATFTKKEYINFLATPRKYVQQPPPPDEISLLKKNLRIKSKEQCSPRLIKLSRPKKVRVFETWKGFFNFLSLNCIERLNELLHTDTTLDPKYARCCFKLMDRRKEKRKSLELRKRNKMLKKEKREGQKWLKIQIRTTATLIIKFLENEPLLTLNFKQMLLSNVILDELVKHGYLKSKPPRNSNNAYRQSIVDIVDQLAVWMDTIIRYIDIQPLDVPDFAASPSLESLLGGEEEEEGEGEGEEEDGKEKRYHLPPLPEIPEFEDLHPYLQYAEAEGDYSVTETTFQYLFDDIPQSRATTVTSITPVVKEEDALKVLIRILINTPDEFLQGLVNPEEFPDITYQDILDRLVNLYDREKVRQKQKRKAILEDSMVAWAKKIEPDKVDERILKEIEDIANILAECMKTDIMEREVMAAISAVSAISAEDTDITILSTVATTTRVSTSEEMDELDADKVLDTLTEEEMEESFKEELGDAEETVPWKVTEVKEESKSEDLLGMTRDIPTMIPKHQPSHVFEHAPDTICCLTIKVWATWLLEVACNAQAWSKWLIDIIREIRRIASIIRGEVKDAQGNTVMFYKEDWIEFSKNVEEMIVSWRQYSMHVKDLTDKIINNFRGKKITCCPKCLEDNLIVNIPAAHDISQQLAEAMNTANYWRRWLDTIVMETKKLTSATTDAMDTDAASSYGTFEIVEIYEPQSSDSEESLYEIEELDPGDYKF